MLQVNRLLVCGDVQIVAYSSGTPSDQPTVVLLHGIGMSHLTWAKVQPNLAAAAHVISFDLPGFGTTRRPDRPFGVPEFAEAADAALDALGVGRRILVGHSMGAQFAVELAARRPELAAGLVLIGPVVEASRRSLLAQARSLAADSLREPPAVNRRVFTDYVKGGVRWYLSTLRAMFAYRIEQRISDTECPVVVMRGEGDPVARQSWCQQLASIAPARTTVIGVPGGAHVIPLTAAEDVGGAVHGLLAPGASDNA